MASRPFASVAVALDVQAEQTDVLLQPLVDVSAALACLHIHRRERCSVTMTEVVVP